MNTFYAANTYDDFEHYTEALTTWDLDLIQLDPGKFHAEMLFYGDTELQVGEVSYNRLLLQRGTGPAAGYTFALHNQVSAPFAWRYMEFPANSIIVFPDNREHQGVSQPGHHPFTVTISETFLATVAEKHGLPEPRHFLPKGEVLQCNPKNIMEIQTLLESISVFLKLTDGKTVDALMNSEIKHKIGSQFLIALAASKNIQPRKRQFSHRKRAVDCVLEYVNADLSTTRSIHELCGVAEVNERTLRNIFYEQFSLSPNKFINRYKLNLVRSDLKKLASRTYIADIANEKGFWHMGQFAADYRNLFGELPSQTRKKY